MFSIGSIFYGGIGAIVLFLVTLAWSIPNKIDNLSTELAQLKHDSELIQARADAYQRGNERRDAAIAASTCSQQIEYWVHNPDEIPKPFDPFNQLNPSNLK